MIPFLLVFVDRLGEGGAASDLSPNRAVSSKEIYVEISTLHEEQSQNGLCAVCDVFCKWSGISRKYLGIPTLPISLSHQLKSYGAQTFSVLNTAWSLHK